MYPYPYMRPSLLGRGLGLSKSINWGGLLDGTQKTLGVINQAIPIVYQVKPIISNAKTMFRIADEFRSPATSTSSTSEKSSSSSSSTSTSNANRPIFYM